MADLTVSADDVAVVESPRQLRSYPAGAAVDAGAPVYIDSNGKVQEGQADGTSAERAIAGLALTTAPAANTAISVAGPGSIVSLGNALGDLALGASVYLSNTAGSLADAAGSVSLVVGTVIPAWGGAAGTADKLLRISATLGG